MIRWPEDRRFFRSRVFFLLREWGFINALSKFKGRPSSIVREIVQYCRVESTFDGIDSWLGNSNSSSIVVSEPTEPALSSFHVNITFDGQNVVDRSGNIVLEIQHFLQMDSLKRNMFLQLPRSRIIFRKLTNRWACRRFHSYKEFCKSWIFAVFTAENSCRTCLHLLQLLRVKFVMI